MHEFGHVIGFPHAQNRPDRNRHLRVLYPHVWPGKLHNFDKVPYGTGQDHTDTPYDASSVMHYSLMVK